jgi:hypothetical protein
MAEPLRVPPYVLRAYRIIVGWNRTAGSTNRIPPEHHRIIVV